VSGARAAVQDWLFREFTSRIATAFETVAGEHPVVSHAESQGFSASGGLSWRQPFSGVPGALWVVAAEPDWVAAAGCVVRAAGIEEQDPAKLKPEYLELLNQTLSGVAQAMAERASREVLSQGGEESGSTPAEAEWASVQVRLGEVSMRFAVGLEFALLDEFVKEPKPEIEAPPDRATTFDLLFDVELPVSVSFGRAQVPLKDVLKLNTGSIIELNRAIGDPVEVIVNNCVIARGEVVVVEGNFGVRIQQVISRQERLRTLT
jgi:flagellar motor switch protein FliN/FliY